MIVGIPGVAILWIVPFFIISFIGAMKKYNKQKNLKIFLYKYIYQRKWYIFWYSVIIFFIHLIIATLMWLAEYNADTIEPESDFAVKGGLYALGQLVQFIIMGTFPHDLHSHYSILYLGILKGGYAFAGIWMTAKVASKFLKRRMAMELKDHIVIVGWNPRAKYIIQELGSQRKSCVVITHLSEDELNISYPNVVTVHYKCLSLEKSLKDGKHWNLKAVVVLADEEWAEKDLIGDVDFGVLKAVQIIRKFERDHKDKRKDNGNPIRVVAEVKNQRNRSSIKDVGAENTETICVNEFGVELLAHAATKPGAIEVFRELLDTKPNSNEFYTEVLESNIIEQAKDFNGLMRLAQESWNSIQNNSNHVLLVGLVKKGKVFLNPDGKTILEPMDQVLFLSDHKRNWKLQIKNLRIKK
jgi:hypothetical protein